MLPRDHEAQGDFYLVSQIVNGGLPVLANPIARSGSGYEVPLSLARLRKFKKIYMKGSGLLQPRRHFFYRVELVECSALPFKRSAGYVLLFPLPCFIFFWRTSCD
jgi:hypothetical protein